MDVAVGLVVGRPVVAGRDETDGRPGGLLRVTTRLPGRREQARRRIPIPVPERDDSGRDIRTADLNALNVMLAVIRWKRYVGTYADATRESFMRADESGCTPGSVCHSLPSSRMRQVLRGSRPRDKQAWAWPARRR